MRAVVVEVEGGNFFAIDINPPSKRIVEAFEECDGCGFAAAGGTDEGDVLAGLDGEIKTTENGDIGTSWVAEVDIAEFECAFDVI